MFGFTLSTVYIQDLLSDKLNPLFMFRPAQDRNPEYVKFLLDEFISYSRSNKEWARDLHS
jgi:hypothetical protein